MDAISHVFATEHGFIFVTVFGMVLYLAYCYFKDDPVGALRRLEYSISQTQCEEFIVLGTCSHISTQLNSIQMDSILWSKMQPIFKRFMVRCSRTGNKYLNIRQIRFQLIEICAELNYPEGIDLIDALADELIGLLKEHQLNVATRINCYRAFERILTKLRWMT